MNSGYSGVAIFWIQNVNAHDHMVIMDRLSSECAAMLQQQSGIFLVDYVGVINIVPYLLVVITQFYFFVQTRRQNS